MLKKLLIVAYEDSHFKQATGQQFQAQINPEKYAESLSVKFETGQRIDPAGVTVKYKGQGPQRLNLDFVLDDTGVLPDNSYEGSDPQSKTVMARLKSFKDVAYKFDGGIHRPRYLKIQWGKLSFSCVLEQLDVEYTLFNPLGLPLRAMLKAVFLYFAADDKLELEARKKSADLTHVRRPAVGETLPLMCYRIYGDSSLYIQVARKNNLNDFRGLAVNKPVVFPPRDELLRQTTDK